MRLTKIQVLAILLILGCNVIVKAAEEQEEKSKVENVASQLDDVTDSNEEVENQSEERLAQLDDELPILPPIILLDFDNGTADGNSTDEKSKRTVNGGLGYGFERNALLSGKYNYYFPAGKTGTTVSIEESISPFLPKTIIEKVQSNSDRSTETGGQIPSAFQGTPSGQNFHFQGFSNSQLQHFAHFPNLQPFFGQSTKLHKTSNTDNYGRFSSTAKPSVNSFEVSGSRYQNGFSSTTPYPEAQYNSAESVNYITPSSIYGVSTPSSYYDSSTPNPVSFESTTPNSVRYSASTANSLNYAAPSASPLRYVTQRPQLSLYQHTGINSQTYSGHRPSVSQPSVGSQRFGTKDIQRHGAIRTSTSNPLDFNSHVPKSHAPYSNLPRYTVENGVRYENKIFWKYPDGRVSDVPPATYVETSYPEFSPSLKKQTSQSVSSNIETETIESGVYSQRPVQFPVIQGSGEQQQQQSPFISSESISSSIPQQQVYRLGYQNLVGQKQNLNLAQQVKTTSTPPPTYSFPSLSSSSRVQGNQLNLNNIYGTSTQTNQRPSISSYTGQRPVVSYANQRPASSTYTSQRLGSPAYTIRQQGTSTYTNQRPSSTTYTNQRPASRYMVNSPNPEYTDSYTTSSPPRNVKTTPTPYNAFSQGGAESSKKNSQTNKNLGDYLGLEYTDLLNYNPSISQYIRNPSSILNVHPTFVQAGSSLVPVIILRVDGAPPLNSKAVPNINLKALLQQYLLQYANSVQELGRSSNYDFGSSSEDQFAKSRSSSTFENRLTDDAKASQDDTPIYPSNDQYVSKSGYDSGSSETEINSGDFGKRTHTRQKVKSVQIIDGPRLTNHKKN